MKLEVTIPGLRVVSTANRREHWATRAKRTKAQRHEAWASMLQAAAEPRKIKPGEKILVHLVRRYPGHTKPMDDDNLAASFKAIRDGVADWLGIDDGSASIVWVVQQAPSDKWAVQILVSKLEEK